MLWAEQQHEKIRTKRGHFHDMMVRRGLVPRFQDPLWDEQWYLVSSPMIKIKTKYFYNPSGSSSRRLSHAALYKRMRVSYMVHYGGTYYKINPNPVINP